MSTHFTDQLSAYLDHDLTPSEHDVIERHLDACGECRATLEQLARVKSHAAALVGPPAPTDLWAGIASRIGTAGSTSVSPARPAVVLELPRRARAWWSQPQWLPAAAAFLVVASIVGFAMRGAFNKAASPVASSTPSASAPASDVAAASFDANQLDSEVEALQKALDRGRGKLDPKTIQVLEDNLRIIHKAIDDAKQALAEDPANRELQDYLVGSVQRKLELVRRAAVMAGV
ncbi:MAG: zf-HC2 domain-containing protein [Gemmatimonadetes bacterium]|nr:zf-HC2 domain-containing protein [Gemmatimonadota bacterium]